MREGKYEIAELVPHSGRMLLLDDIHDYGEDWLQAVVRISNASTFFQNGGVPSLFAIEYMAQTIAAFSGLQDKKADRPIKLGLLTGCRKFIVETDRFLEGQELTIQAKEYFRDGNMAVFDCWVRSEKLVATAKINVYVLEKIEDVFK